MTGREMESLQPARTQRNRIPTTFRHLGGLSLIFFLAACGGVQAPVRPTVSLRMQPATGTPPDATVIIDEEAVGALDFIAQRGVALPPGVHHVTVKAHGFFPWDREVEAHLGAPPIRLEVSLIPVPD